MTYEDMMFAELLEQLFEEIEQYLEAVEMFRGEGCELRWRLR